MNSQLRIIACRSNLVKIIGSVALFIVTAGAASAQSPLKATGEIVSASKTTINGFSAVSGATVFNNNRIRTGKGGAAIINLGRLGRIELAPETDLTLRISESSIGGELRSNQMVVSAQKGVAIAVNTVEGIVTTDGREPAVLTIYLDGKHPRVITHRGAANVVTTGEKDGEKGSESGKALAPSPRGNGLRRGGQAGSIVAPASLGPTIIHQAVSRGSNPMPFSRLFKAGINYSTGSKPSGSQSGQGSKNSFESSITCQNNNHPSCASKSNYKPR
jgi:hypothetical protein